MELIVIAEKFVIVTVVILYDIVLSKQVWRLIAWLHWFEDFLDLVSLIKFSSTEFETDSVGELHCQW